MGELFESIAHRHSQGGDAAELIPDRDLDWTDSGIDGAWRRYELLAA